MVTAGEVFGDAAGFGDGCGALAAFEPAKPSVMIGPTQFIADILPGARLEDADDGGTGFDALGFHAPFVALAGVITGAGGAGIGWPATVARMPSRCQRMPGSMSLWVRLPMR